MRVTAEELRALAEPWIPRELPRPQGKAYESPNGFFWLSWGTHSFAFHLTIGEWGFTRDAKRSPR